MIQILSFETELQNLKSRFEHGEFCYSDLNIPWNKAVRNHFSNMTRVDKHGVYVVRLIKSHEVIYIGKGGTITNSEEYKNQDIPGRLNAPRRKGMNSKQWFMKITREKGSIKIEYVFLPTSISPHFTESLLLQSFLNEYGKLPAENLSL